MWRLDGAVGEAQSRIEAALDAGITLFDTADIYGPDGAASFGAAEALFGRALSASPGLREKMVIATKGGIVFGTPYDQSPTYLAAALDASLARLQTERVELYQIHRPDVLAHPQEVARVLDDAVAAGKIAAVGVSNFTPAQTRALARFLTVPIVSTQPEWSPLTIAPVFDGTADLALEETMAVLAWSPIAGGRLMNPSDDRSRGVAALLDVKASEAGVDRAAAACSWIMAHPTRPIPIIGTQNPVRIAEAANAFVPRWSRQEWYAVLQEAMGEKLP